MEHHLGTKFNISSTSMQSADEQDFVSSPESLGSQGELIGWP